MNFGHTPNAHTVYFPDGRKSVGVEVDRGLYDLGPDGVRLEIGDHLVIGRRDARVAGFLRGTREGLPDQWSGGEGTLVWIEWLVAPGANYERG